MALSSAWKRMSWLYYQYLLVTALYMLEPWERTVFSILYSLTLLSSQSGKFLDPSGKFPFKPNAGCLLHRRQKTTVA
uniref:Uncharacterized protein n=1 Tax=Laticauda laticaudata TaxID=8630 RepID=A0A8C5WPK6_LATLA